MDFHRKHLDRRNKKLYILSFYSFRVQSKKEKAVVFWGTERLAAEGGSCGKD